MKERDHKTVFDQDFIFTRSIRKKLNWQIIVVISKSFQLLLCHEPHKLKSELLLLRIFSDHTNPVLISVVNLLIC